MRIISTTDLSREGNDCSINESISLVEQFELYAIIRCLKIVGNPNVENVEVLFSSRECNKAIEAYDRFGGTIK